MRSTRRHSCRVVVASQPPTAAGSRRRAATPRAATTLSVRRPRLGIAEAMAARDVPDQPGVPVDELVPRLLVAGGRTNDEVTDFGVLHIGTIVASVCREVRDDRRENSWGAAPLLLRPSSQLGGDSTRRERRTAPGREAMKKSLSISAFGASSCGPSKVTKLLATWSSGAQNRSDPPAPLPPAPPGAPGPPRFWTAAHDESPPSVPLVLPANRFPDQLSVCHRVPLVHDRHAAAEQILGHAFDEWQAARHRHLVASRFHLRHPDQ